MTPSPSSTAKRSASYRPSSGDQAPVWLLRALVGRWKWMALAALFSAAVTLRLGFWQLDRLAQRRDVNFQLGKRLVTEPLRLPGDASQHPPSDAALRELEFRSVVLRGYWDFSKERAL